VVTRERTIKLKKILEDMELKTICPAKLHGIEKDSGFQQAELVPQ
jgi:hypothetical protein